jgi:hypothetical protein
MAKLVIYDDSATERPEDAPVLTVKFLDEVIERLRRSGFVLPPACEPLPWSPTDPLAPLEPKP